MKHYPAEIVAGMRRMIEAAGARRGKFGIRTKNASAIDAIWPHLDGSAIDLVLLHESIAPAIAGHNKVEALGALGIIESFSVASLIEAADAAVKSANVTLIEIRLAMALGGKAFCTMTGNVAAVRSAVEAGAAVVASRGLLTNKVVIANPRPELLSELI